MDTGLREALELCQAGSFQEAERKIADSLSRRPAWPEALNLLGACFATQQRFEDAAGPLGAAIRGDPRNPEFRYNLGIVYLALRRPEDAVKPLARGHELAPGDPEMTAALAEALAAAGGERVKSGRLAAGAGAYYRALRLRPDFSEVWNNLGTASLKLGRLRTALGAFRRSMALSRTGEAISNYLYTLNFSPRHTPVFVAREHRRLAATFPSEAPGHPNDRSPGRPLRVGYVCAEIRQHPASYFMEPVFTHHDRKNFEVFCYANLAEPDHYTARLRGLCDHWRNIAGLDDDAVVRLIGDDRIDILVDRVGHSGNNRAAVFARRPAPVQVSLPGYPATTGLAAMDYRFTDRNADPPGLTEHLHAETLVRLPGCFQCYQPPPEAPGVGPLPALSNGKVTFGAFHARPKFSRKVVAVWAGILHKVPESTLLFHHFFGRAECAPEFRNPLVRMFREKGIVSRRLAFVGNRPLAGHLALFREADLMLDPFPFSANTIACESLWMGVPLVTLAGATHVSRTCASILRTAGLPEFVAETAAEYVRIAEDWAGNIERLAGLRAVLRERVAASPLVDGKAHARALEEAYRWMWRRWCSSTPVVIPPG